MSLRALKKEVDELPALSPVLSAFQRSWLLPIRKGLAVQKALLYELPLEQQVSVRKKVAWAQLAMKQLKQSTALQEQLHLHAHHLIELQLALFQKDRQRATLIMTRFLKDDCFPLSKALHLQQELAHNVKVLSSSYRAVNDKLLKHLPLDGRLRFQELNHEVHLSRVRQHVMQQQRLLKTIGQKFIGLANSAKKEMLGSRKW